MSKEESRSWSREQPDTSVEPLLFKHRVQFVNRSDSTFILHSDAYFDEFEVRKMQWLVTGCIKPVHLNYPHISIIYALQSLMCHSIAYLI